MTILVYLSIFLGIALFVIGSVLRILQYARLPQHLRWELYPVPHEAPERARHGGSYFETQRHWLQPQSVHHVPEWLAMCDEMILLKSLRLHHPRLWRASFAFHFGLYLIFAALPVALLRLVLHGPAALLLLAYASAILAGAGALGIVLGAIFLLKRRLSDPAQINSTKPADIFNLVFFLVTFAVLGTACLLRPQGTAGPGALLRGLLHFDPAISVGPLLAAGLILGSALLAYIPFTHMAHFIGKYFAWHAVRWDDRRNQPFSAGERRVAEYLSWTPHWSARHMDADGIRTWSEIATANPTVTSPQEKRK